MAQATIERELRLTQEEAKYINTNRHRQDVRTFINLLRLQVSFREPAGFALLEASLDDVRRNR